VDIYGIISDWLVWVLQQFGQPLSLGRSATAFSDHAADLRALTAPAHSGRPQHRLVRGRRNRHAAYWQSHATLFDQAAEHLDAAQKRLDEHLQKVWAIFREIIGVILEIVELFAVGAALTWLTGVYQISSGSGRHR